MEDKKDQEMEVEEMAMDEMDKVAGGTYTETPDGDILETQKPSILKDVLKPIQTDNNTPVLGTENPIKTAVNDPTIHKLDKNEPYSGIWNKRADIV